MSRQVTATVDRIGAPLPTLETLWRRDHCGSKGIQEERTYTVVRASFGDADGLIGTERDTARAHLVIRDEEKDALFLIRPEVHPMVGADGGMYYDVALECYQIQEA